MSENATAAAVKCWNGLVVGGEELKCCPMIRKCESQHVESEEEWQEWCSTAEHALRTTVEDATMEEAAESKVQQRTNILLENALTEDDLEDEEWLEGSLNNIREIAF